MLLMGIRFKLLSKSFMFKILIFLISEVGDGTGWKREGKNLDDVFEDLIVAFFGCKIENLAKAADDSYPMDERIKKLIDFFVLIFVPDLEVAKPLI